MNLSLSFVHQINKFRCKLVETLKVDSASSILSKHCECFQSRLSCKLVVQSLSKDFDNLVNFSIFEDFMSNVKKLCHANDTALFDFLINVLFLKLLQD